MNPLSNLPSVSRLLAEAQIVALIDRQGLAVITRLVREVLAEARDAGRAGVPVPDVATLVAQVDAGAATLARA
jgi:L-seryl-tRNA(Ser) seleniumtransferase